MFLPCFFPGVIFSKTMPDSRAESFIVWVFFLFVGCFSSPLPSDLVVPEFDVFLLEIVNHFNRSFQKRFSALTRLFPNSRFPLPRHLLNSHCPMSFFFYSLGWVIFIFSKPLRSRTKLFQLQSFLGDYARCIDTNQRFWSDRAPWTSLVRKGKKER